MAKKKIIRVTTVPQSLKSLLKGQLKFMSNYFEVVGISSGGPFLDVVSKNEGIRVIPVEMTRKITPLSDLNAVIKLYSIFKKEKPEIVHSHTPKAGTVGMLAAKLAGVPHRLHTIAGLPLVEEKGIKRIILNLVEKITYSCATQIYPNSYGLNEIILEHKFTKPSKLKVIGNGSSNGIDTTHFDPNIYTKKDKEKLKKKLNIPEDSYVFIYVGRFVKDKGINELLSSFENVNKNYPNTRLLLVGGYERELDPLSEESEKLIDNHPAIICAGWQEDVRPYFAIAHTLVFPSYREGFPNVVMQAGAMGLMSIVTNINGCNEIIIEGENGIIVPVKSTEALIKGMELFLGDKTSKLNDSEKIRTMIIDRYEQKFIWNKLKNEYQNLLND